MNDLGEKLERDGGKNRIITPSSWLLFLLILCLLLTLTELLIVNRKHGLFTGGFLASPLSGFSEVSILIFTVYLSNLLASLICFLPFSMLFIYFRISMPMALALSGFISLLPIILADLITYQLAKYLGDMISFHLLYQIAGGSIATMLSQVGENQWVLISFGILGLLAAFYIIGKLWSRNQILSKHYMKRRTAIVSISSLMLGVIILAGTASLSSELLGKSLRRFPAPRMFQACLHYLSDTDGDGYSAFSHPPDPDGRNPNLFPYAPDIPGNGVDENGLLGDLPLDFTSTEKNIGKISEFQRRPLFLLLVLESFRSDLLFKKIKGKEITPNLNRLASQGIYTLWGFSHNGYTVGSLTSIFKGSLSSADTIGTLVDDFKANGYDTACFSAENESFGNVDVTIGLNEMDHYYDARQDVERRAFTYTASGSLIVPSEVVLERLALFLDNRLQRDTPLFLYVNLQDLHFPYHHYAVTPRINAQPLPRSKISIENRNQLIATYLNTAAYLDDSIGRLVSKLANYGNGELALVALADHGESLFDDKYLGHGHHLTDIQTRIPIIVKGFPAILHEPMGQSDIRSMIQDGLMVAKNQQIYPSKTINSDKKIFQYIGNIKKPRQIGWATMHGRLTLDIRERMWGKGSDLNSWRKLNNKGVPDKLIELVHFWETVQLKELGIDSINQ